MIQLFIGAAGGVGTSVIAKGFAEEEGGLLIEGANRTRVQDLMADAPEHLYDYYDFVRGVDPEKVILHLESYDLIQGSPFHDLEEVDERAFKEAMDSIHYDKIHVDLSRFRDVDLIYWGRCADRIYLIGNGTRASLRTMEGIRFVLQKNRLRPDYVVVLNRMKSGDDTIADDAKKISETVYTIREGKNPLDPLLHPMEGNQKEPKRGFWDFFKRK